MLSFRPSANRNPKHGNPSFWKPISALLILIAMVLAPLSAQTLDSLIKNPKSAQAIRDSAEVLTRNHSAATAIKNLGYAPASEELWRGMPAVRQVEAAYIAAENVKRGGGDEMLALLSQDLARQYGPEQLPGSLKPYTSVKVDKRPVFQVEPHHAVLPVITTPGTAAGYRSLEKYVKGSRLGGPNAILRDYVGVPEEVANDIIATSPDMSEAFKRAINWVPEQQRAPKVAHLVDDIQALYGESARADHALDVFHKPAERRPIEASLAPALSGPTKPPVPGSFGPAAPSPASPGPMIAPPPEFPSFREPVAPQSYPNFVKANYTSATSGFSEMIEIEGGFGGVVFGSEVKADPALGKLTSVDWAAESGDTSKGNLRLQFAGTAARTWGPVLYEDALTAMKMVSGGPGLPAWKPSDGIGLVGLDVKHGADYSSCDQDCKIGTARRWNVILHPALANTALGWSAIMVDTLPTNSRYFEELSQGKVTDAERQKLMNWERSNPGNYKFIDTPIRISESQGGGLSVVPGTPAGNGPASGSDATFLAVKPFGSNPEKKETFQNDFPRVAPTILNISVYHARLNRFAPVLGIMRWARTSGASINVEAGTLRSVPTPGSVAAANSGVIPLDAFENTDSAADENAAIIGKTAVMLIEKLPEPLRARYTAIRVALSHITEYEPREEAATDERLAVAISLDRWEERLQAFLKTSPALRANYQAIALRISADMDAIAVDSGTGDFASSLEKLTGEQGRLDAWLLKSAPAFAKEHSQLDAKWNGQARLVSEYRERISELRESIPSVEENREALLSMLPADHQAAYKAAVARRDLLIKQAGDIRKQADALSLPAFDSTRLDKALAAVSPAGRAAIKQADAVVDSLELQAEASKDPTAEAALNERLDKAMDAADTLRQKYLASWYSENKKLQAEYDAKSAEADKVMKDADAAGGRAEAILSEAFPEVQCVENLLAWNPEDDDPFPR